LGDYLEEINTALSIQDEDLYYESLEDVVSDLERERITTSKVKNVQRQGLVPQVQ
jgi:UDP-N-acetylglucosamine:LPS N-acetylglucosamine transferase